MNFRSEHFLRQAMGILRLGRQIPPQNRPSGFQEPAFRTMQATSASMPTCKPGSPRRASMSIAPTRAAAIAKRSRAPARTEQRTNGPLLRRQVLWLETTGVAARRAECRRDPVGTSSGSKNPETSGRLVGAAGFELATPCSQSRCSTRLSYAPSDLAEMSAGLRRAGQACVRPAAPGTLAPREFGRPRAGDQRAAAAEKTGCSTRLPGSMP